MARLNYQKALQAGYSDQEIQDFAKKNKVEVYNQQSQQPLLAENPGLDMLTGAFNYLTQGAQNVAKDIGAGSGQADNPVVNTLFGAAPKVDQAQQQANQLADQAATKAKQTNNPAEQQRLLKIAQQTAQTGSQNAQQLASQFSPDVQQNPFLRGAVAGSEITGVADVPAIAAKTATIASKIPQATALLTKKGAAQAATKAAQQATEAGKSMHWDDLASQIRKEATNLYGNTPSVKSAINKLLSPEVPGGIASQPETMQKSASDLLTLRRQIQQRGGGGLLRKALMGTNVDEKVANTARRVISDNIHKLAPETIKPDQAYALWSKLGGSPAQWAGRLAIGATAGNLAKRAGVPQEGLIDALATLAAGRFL